jgi:HSP20 family protein
MSFGHNDPFQSTRKAFRTMVDDLLNKSIGDIMGGESVVSRPLANVRETENAYLLELAVPGVSKEQVRLGIEANQLVIRAAEEGEREESSEQYSRREFNYQSFERRFTLPEQADHDKVEARMEHGVLHVTIGKKEQARAKEARTINID